MIIKNIAKKAAIYLLLTIFGFVFIYPLIYMFFKSFMPLEDYFNPLVNLIPSQFSITNYVEIFSRISLWKSILYGIFLAGVSTLLQTLSCATVGYGFSRFDFRFKNLFLILVLVSFIIPTQVTMIGTYLGYSQLNLLGSPLAFFLPATFAQGLKSSIFIMIFYSFFNSIPKVLDEAAAIDGASTFVIFYKVALPLAKPAIILTVIFSMVWYWNETYLAALYIGSDVLSLSNQVALSLASIDSLAQTGQSDLQVYESVKMAGGIIMIIPLLIFYLVLQRHFVESIAKTGITGE